MLSVSARGFRLACSRRASARAVPPATAIDRGFREHAVSRKVFINLPVKDLGRSVAFFTAHGFTFDERFTDDDATCMILGDEAFVMLLAEERFREFTKKDLCDATTQWEVFHMDPSALEE